MRQQSPGSAPEAPASAEVSHDGSAGNVPGEVGMGGRSRYAMNDDDAADEAEGVEGGSGSGGQEDAKKGADQEEEDDDDDDGEGEVRFQRPTVRGCSPVLNGAWSARE